MSPFGAKKNFGFSDSLLDAVRGVVSGEKQEELEEKKLDPVGREDDDVDNDGDVDSSDEYLKKRRKAIGKAMKGKKDEVDTDPKLDENLDEAMRVLATKGKTKVVTKGDGVAKVMVGGKEVASGDLDDGAGGWFMSRKGEKGQKFFDSPKKIADFYAEEAIMERKDDTATLVAKALKKMGVKPNAKEADVIKKIPDVLKKMGMQQALNMMNRDKDYRNDMLGDVLDSLSDMKEGLDKGEDVKTFNQFNEGAFQDKHEKHYDNHEDAIRDLERKAEDSARRGDKVGASNYKSLIRYHEKARDSHGKALDHHDAGDRQKAMSHSSIAMSKSKEAEAKHKEMKDRGAID